ncbi:SEC-C domain-containing protein [Deferrisoma palaeochoriense]
MADQRFRGLTDDELVELLYTAGDRLPREAVEEFLRRGDRMLPRLAEIVSDKRAWTQQLPEWWAVVHATYILGAMETGDALVPLLTALRWADAFDCDWVTEDLPSIFGRIGDVAHVPLMRIVADVTAGPGARSVALASAVAAAIGHRRRTREVTETAAAILRSPQEPLYLRQTAANVLVDLKARRYRDLLLAFGREEAARHRDDPDYQGVFYDWEVDDLLEDRTGDAGLEYYQRDWLTFYDPEEIEKRQERWRREEQEAESAGEPVPSHPARPDLGAPCPCGSGRPFGHCCYLRMH